MNTVIQTIQNRVSSPRLKAPAPTDTELNEILLCAMRAPDHARLKPWKYHVVSGEGLMKLGEVFASCAGVDAPQDKVEKCRNMPKRAPLMLVAVCEPQENAKVPAMEQILAVGAGIQNMQIAINSLGYSSIWRTGDMAHAQAVKEYFGVSDSGEIVGFLYIGTAEKALQTPSLSLDGYVQYWD